MHESNRGGILALGPNPEVVGAMRDALTSEGWWVRVALAADEATGPPLGTPPCAIVVDVDGLRDVGAIVRGLRTRWGGELGVVLVGTAGVLLDARRSVGAAGYLVKPFGLADLSAAIRRASGRA